MTLPPNQRLLWGAIASFSLIGAGTIRRFQKHKLGAEDIWQASQSTLREIGVSDTCCERFVPWRTSFDLEKFEQTLTDEGIRIVLREDLDYPLSLTTIHDPPEVLFVRGVLPSNRPTIAVVGTRRPSEYGSQALERIVGPIAEQGIPIISGLALGTDAFAHALALNRKSYTCAVLASGVDQKKIYPRFNQRLAEQILEQGGCLLSEAPPGTRPRPEAFPIRNRLIAGLAQAVVVIEAAIDSGTLITARLALDHGQEVLAVPGSIWSDVSAGTHQLIRSGARLCAEANDILQALNLDRAESSAQAQVVLPLTPDERSLFEYLTSPQTSDELARGNDWSIGRISQALSMLELKQLVVRLDHHLWGRI
ncbi:DNA-processing protein DprA [Patescibacteria group bacterium]|nr:DNA-processing protein DprA [Patescibacteria group bacterium]